VEMPKSKNSKEIQKVHQVIAIMMIKAAVKLQ